MTTSTQPARALRAGQIALGLIWLIDGALQFQPYMFHSSFVTGVILPNADGQPGFIAAPITWIAHQIAPHVALFNAFGATLEVLIAVGLVAGGRFVKPALIASVAWAVGIWFTGEGLGGFFSGGANPLTGAPGAALLYIVAGLMLWPRADRRALGLLRMRGAQAAWAALWMSSAVLWLLPANDGRGAIHDAIASAPSGFGPLSSVLDAVARATAGHGVAIAAVLAALSWAIGASVLTGVAQRPFVRIGIALSIAFWVVGQGLGGVFTGSGTDVGTAPLVILLGGLLLAATPAHGASARFRIEYSFGTWRTHRAVDSS
jgi:hypothetical protein